MGAPWSNVEDLDQQAAPFTRGQKLIGPLPVGDEFPILALPWAPGLDVYLTSSITTLGTGILFGLRLRAYVETRGTNVCVADTLLGDVASAQRVLRARGNAGDRWIVTGYIDPQFAVQNLPDDEDILITCKADEVPGSGQVDCYGRYALLADTGPALIALPSGAEVLTIYARSVIGGSVTIFSAQGLQPTIALGIVETYYEQPRGALTGLLLILFTGLGLRWWISYTVTDTP